jgi:cell pole-organizing protein PopZ
MSAPDSTGQSLESILASIRKSLAEQSTDVLDEETVGSAAGTAPDGAAQTPPPLLPESAAGHLPGAAAEVRADAAAKPALQEPALQPVAAPLSETALSAAALPASDGTGKDPLWFLGREPAEKNGGQPAEPDAPRPSAAGVTRGSLPPFFGSNTEVPKAEAVPASPVLAGIGTLPPVTPSPAPVGAARGAHGDAAHATSGASENGFPDGYPWPRDAAPGPASSIFGYAPVDDRNGAAGISPQMQALEVMVAELLRPMLRRWLDENMPRLVSAALKAEAELVAKRGPKA